MSSFKIYFACSSKCFCIHWFVYIKMHALTLASVSGADLINHRIPLPLKKHFPQKKCRRLHDLSTEAVHKRANSTNDWTVSYLIVHIISFPLFHWTFREISNTVRRERNKFSLNCGPSHMLLPLLETDYSFFCTMYLPHLLHLHPSVLTLVVISYT